MSDDINKVAKIEKAIAEKYGEKTIQNPKKLWTKEKEKKYIEQSQKFYKKIQKNEHKEEVQDYKGILVSKKLINKESSKACLVCKIYSLKKKDTLYINRYECCFVCYIEYVEGREERWKTGWRPEID